MTAAIWNKMGIDYQMMFNSKDAARCYKGVAPDRAPVIRRS